MSKFLRSTVFAALAAASLVAATAQSASAQKVVAATCPDGYVLSGNRCLRTAPTPSCPSGYTFSAGKCTATTQVSSRAGKSSSGGQWTFVTREAFGVRSAKEVDGANYCAVAGSSSADAAEEYFKDNGLDATYVEVANDRAGIETYQKYDCDLLVVADRVAVSTAKTLKPKGSHIVLPEKFGTVDVVETPEPVAPAAPPAAVTKTPAPVKAAPVKQASHKPVRKVRCSAVRYGYTRGNTCGCAGGRVFTGSRCVRRRY